MARRPIDKTLRRNIVETQRLIGEAERLDCNEAETRRRIERIFETLMGYDPFKHLSRERAVRGAGDTEHMDFAISIDDGDDAKPSIVVEIKRVNTDLASKHIRQAASYAINAGCEWVILTNAREWRLYHISFGQPPETKLIHAWNFVTSEMSVIVDRLELLSYRNVRRGALDELWRKTSILDPRSLLGAILCEPAINTIRRELRRDSGVPLSPEDILAGIRRLLNDTALAELGQVRISLPKKKTRTRKRPAYEEPPSEGSGAIPDFDGSSGAGEANQGSVPFDAEGSLNRAEPTDGDTA